MACGTGSYKEPIFVSDEEDAAFVENELSRWTDSSSSSVYDSPSFGGYPSSPPMSEAVLDPVVSPVSGQKRKWIDMRDLGNSPVANLSPEHQSGSKKKKKKLKKEQQAQLYAQASYSVTPGAAQGSSYDNVKHISPGGLDIKTDSTQGLAKTTYHTDYASSLSHTRYSYDPYSYRWPHAPSTDPYQIASTSCLSSADEYNPADGLWAPSDRPSVLSPLAAPWDPSFTSSFYTTTQPSVKLEPEELSHPRLPPEPPQRGRASAPTSVHAPQPKLESPQSDTPSSSLPSIYDLVSDSSLSERLRQLEALSASLLALTKGKNSSGSVALSSIPIPISTSTPVGEPPPPPREQEDLPAKPMFESAEPLKRLIGIPDDKGHHGYFDVRQPGIEPPALGKPPQPITTHTIVMALLPRKFRKLDFVTTWAKRFTVPKRVLLDVKAGKALVEWVDPTPAHNAFTSLRLRGEGKEHIRVYRYCGARPPHRSVLPAGPSKVVKKEIEEGEIEEGELVEVVETTTKTKKKKNKGKNKASQAELRPSEPRRSARLAVLAMTPPATAPKPSYQLPPHMAQLAAVADQPLPSPTLGNGSVLTKVASPPWRHEEVSVRPAGETEMELESDAEKGEPVVISSLVPPVADPTEVNGAEDMDLEDDADVVGGVDVGEDVDMEMSSPVQETFTSLPDYETSPRLPHRVTPPLSELEEDTALREALHPPSSPSLDETALAAREARRGRLREAIERTKAQLALREQALSSRTSLISSSGSSESPEPSTPVDLPLVSGVEAAIVRGETEVAVHDVAGTITIKTKEANTGTATLDELAVSFIAESIHDATAHLQPLAASPPSGLPNTSSTMLAVAPTPVPFSSSYAPVFASPSAPALTPLTEEEKQAKRMRWLGLVSMSKSLIEKVAKANTKEEKVLLMRMLKAKTKAADELKREIDSGFALPPESTANSSSSSSSSATGTPTPAPHSGTPSATPTPATMSVVMSTSTPIPTPTTSLSKRRTTPPASAPLSTSFRWPETPREVVIVVSDDEAD